MKKLKILITLGTRPEVIKLAPVYRAFKRNKNCEVKICKTGQHKQLADSMINLFNLTIDYNLNVMSENQSLAILTSLLFERMDKVIVQEKPDWLLVQGDTTSSMVSAFAAFYRRVPVAHVEAGLRTGNIFAPFPEEVNRLVTSRLATRHFAPTETAKKALLSEGINEENIEVTGNTVVDSLQWCVRNYLKNYTPTEISPSIINRRFILVTTHRRENFGSGLQNICKSISNFARKNPQALVIWPLHLNPNVYKPVQIMIRKVENIKLLSPLSYLTMLWLIKRCYIVLSDSGGIQEEAPSFKKPVLVMRHETERPEGVHAGVARLVGTDPELILSELNQLWSCKVAYSQMTAKKNPYGDGKAGDRIARIIMKMK